jgi:hypothetical protein
MKIQVDDIIGESDRIVLGVNKSRFTITEDNEGFIVINKTGESLSDPLIIQPKTGNVIRIK